MATAKKAVLAIGLIQTQVSKNPQKNIENTIVKIKKAARQGAQIICLQELFKDRYFPMYKNKDVKKLAQNIPGPLTETFSDLAKSLNIVIILPLFEETWEKYFNSVVVIDADGKLLGTYRKAHVPQDPSFYEKNYFERGNTGFPVFQTKYGKVGVLICYDQWFPEAARVLALKGADIIFYPTAIGHLKGDPLSFNDWLSGWVTIQKAHAIANSVHVASVNRVGKEGKIQFWGSSFICDAFGRILKQASKVAEEVLVAEVDLGKNKAISEGWGFRENRCPDTYTLVSSNIASQTPKNLGYFMPAEWAKHQATWLAWPYDRDTFPNLESVENTYVQIIKNLQEGEDINLFVTGTLMENRVRKLFTQNEIDPQKLHFYHWEYGDVWFRDYGPIFVVNNGRQKAITHWIFNAWGGKYTELLKDTQIPEFINQSLHLPYFRPEIILEGGSIDNNGNGKGIFLTTEQCLLNPNRNSHLSRRDLERYLHDYLGAAKVIWLREGATGDDTDGHVDDIARFVNPKTVLCGCEDNPEDENHIHLKENYEILLRSKDQDGKKLNVIKIPMPPPKYRTFRGEKRRVPASYLNFYIANAVVLVPTFRHEKDTLALKIIQEQFPKRKVVGIDCFDLIDGFGAIHCITQQEPAPAID